jgi:hypothetical protein
MGSQLVSAGFPLKAIKGEASVSAESSANQRFLVMTSRLLHVLAGFIVTKEDDVLRRPAKLSFQIPKRFQSRV